MSSSITVMQFTHKLLLIAACAVAAALASGGPRAPCGAPPPAVNYTNEQYLGHWYEMGRVQTLGGALFQIGCMCSVSDFETQELDQGNGNITYTCRKNSPDAELTAASAELVFTGTPGYYYQVYPWTNATMLNYYVIYIDEDSAMEYDCGTGDTGVTNYCVHILSRTPYMEPTKLQALLDYAESLGLNPNGIGYNPISHEGCW